MGYRAIALSIVGVVVCVFAPSVSAQFAESASFIAWIHPGGLFTIVVVCAFAVERFGVRATLDR